MNISHLCRPILRTTTAAVLATVGLGTGQPGIAHAAAGDNSTFVIVENQTNQTLTMYRHRLGSQGGKWVTRPSTSMSPGSTDSFKTESNVDHGWTGANVYYRTASGQEIIISFNNVYADRNYFYCGVPDDLSCDTNIVNNSAHAEVTFSIG